MPGANSNTTGNSKQKRKQDQGGHRNAKKSKTETRVNREFVDLLYQERANKMAKQKFEENNPGPDEDFVSLASESDEVVKTFTMHGNAILSTANEAIEVDRNSLVQMAKVGFEHTEKMCHSIYKMADKALNKATQNARILKNTSVRIVGVPKSAKDKSLEVIVREILTNGLKFSSNTVKKILDHRMDITRPAVSESTRPFIILRCGSVDDRKVIMAAARQHLNSYRYSGTGAKISINPDQTPEDYLHSRKAQTLCRILMKIGYADEVKVTQNVLLVVGDKSPVHYTRLLEHLPGRPELLKKLDEVEGTAGPGATAGGDPEGVASSSTTASA